MVSPILELKNINKSFGHVQANKNINLKITQGTILIALNKRPHQR